MVSRAMGYVPCPSRSRAWAMRAAPRTGAGMGGRGRVAPAPAGETIVAAAPLAICSLTCWAVAWWAWTLAIRVSRSGASKMVSGSVGLAARRAAWVVAKAWAMLPVAASSWAWRRASSAGGVGAGVGVAFCHVGRILG